MTFVSGAIPFSANGKAIALGEDQGLVKTIFDRKTRTAFGCAYGGCGSD